MRRVICMIVCALFACAALAGCVPKAQSSEAEQPGEELRDTVIYYIDENSFLVPVMVRARPEDATSKQVLSNLATPPEDCGLVAAVPESARFDVRIKQGKALVDVTGLGEFETPEEERNAIAAIVNTAMEIPAVVCVKISMEGKTDAVMRHGTDLSQEFSYQDLNAEPVSATIDAGLGNKLTLYFPVKDGAVIVPVTRVLEDVPTVRRAIQELIKGPESGMLISCIPKDTQLNGVTFKEAVATIDFSKQFNNVADMRDVALQTLALTCSQFGVKGVKVIIDGKESRDKTVFAPLYPNIVE